MRFICLSFVLNLLRCVLSASPVVYGVVGQWSTANIIPAKGKHRAVMDPTGTMWVFGGCTNTSDFVREIWVHSFVVVCLLIVDHLIQSIDTTASPLAWTFQGMKKGDTYAGYAGPSQAEPFAM